MNELLELRASFLEWDDQRRKKVDLILDTIDTSRKYVDYEQTKIRLKEIAKNEELLPASLKMLHLHYLDLSMSIIKKNRMRRRYTRARRKLRRLKKEGHLKE